MDINSVKTLVNFCSNKTGRGYMTANDFNNVILFAETMFVAERIGLPEQYVAGKATGKEAYPLTQKIENDLRPYLESIFLDVSPTSGVLPIPIDYLFISSLSSNYVWTKAIPPKSLDYEAASAPPTIVTTTREVNIDVLINKAYTDRKSHSYDYPTTEFPICTFYDYGIEFLPLSIGQVRFDYISIPKGAYWGFNTIGNVEVYDASKSKQLQCPQDCYYKIMAFVLKNLGINLSDEAVQKYGQELLANGE